MLRAIVLLSSLLSCAHAVSIVGETTVSHFEVVKDFSLKEVSPSTHPESPHGDIMQLSFDAFGQHFEHELVREHDTFHEDAYIRFHGADGKELYSKKPQVRTYRTRKGVVPTVAAYIHSKDHVHALIVTPDEVYTLCEDEKKPGQMVFYKDSDVIETDPLQDHVVEMIKDETSATQRRLLQNINDKEHQGVEVWDNCWAGQDQAPKALTVGIGVDTGFWLRFANQSDADNRLQATIGSIIAYANLIYGQQMNVYLTVVNVTVYKKLGVDTPLWNKKPNCNNIAPSAHLEEFQKWRARFEPNSAGIWHLLTDCHPPPGVVGAAYVGTLCIPHGVGLSSYQDNGAKQTWKTFAHEVGHSFAASHSFEEGRATTGGLMDYGDSKYKGVYQFNTKYRKTKVCQMIQSSMLLKTGSDICWINGKGDSNTVKAYIWDKNGPSKGCSKICGGGIAVTTVQCKELGTGTAVRKTFCDPKTEPLGDESVCNVLACNTQNCAACSGLTNCCGAGCELSATCADETRQRNAGFKTIGMDAKTYIFRGADFSRYTGDSDIPDPGFPRRINGSFASLSPAFQEDIDAAVIRQDGDIFFFKGDEFVKYSLSAGQFNGYPKKITEGFIGMPFISGVDSAISTKTGAIFFKGDRMVEYATNQLAQISPTRAIGQLQLSFMEGIDAAVNQWDGIVRLYRNGQVLLWQMGVGEVAPPQAVKIIGEPGLAVLCPLNCDECEFSTTCLKCAEDFKFSGSAPGTCIPDLYALDLPFDNQAYDIAQFESHNLPIGFAPALNAWRGNIGNTGGAVRVKKNNFMQLKPLDSTFPQFSFHGWVNLDPVAVVNGETLESQTLVTIQFDDGMYANWTLARDTVEVRGLLPVFQVGNEIVKGNTPVVPGLWKHIHADLLNNNLCVSVDAVEICLPYGGGKTKFGIRSWRMGASTLGSDGVNGLLDAFHFDSDIAFVDPNAPLESDVSLAVGMAFLSSAVVLAGSFVYCAKVRPNRADEGNTGRNDAIFGVVLSLCLFLLIVLVAIVAHPTIQLAFILPTCLIFALAGGVLAFFVHRNGGQWLWPAGKGNLGKMQAAM